MIATQRLKSLLRPVVRFVKFRVIHIDDSAHRIALGAAFGVFTAYLPPFGYHIILVITLCLLFKANKFVALTLIWVSNPLTLVPIYYPNYLVGRVVANFFHTSDALSSAQAAGLLKDCFSLSNIIAGFGNGQLWHQLGSLAIRIGIELTIGGVIIGGSIAAAVYLVTSHFVLSHRRKNPHRRFIHRQ